jgi:hypothetical protein
VQVFWALLQIIVNKHISVIQADCAAESLDESRLAAAWQLREQTLTFLITEIDHRYHSLIRGWWIQKLDVRVEAQSYAGGFFWGWYKEVSSRDWCPQTRH